MWPKQAKCPIHDESLHVEINYSHNMQLFISNPVFKKSNPRPFLSEWDHFHCWERNPTFSEGSRPEVDNIKLSKIDSEPFLPSTGKKAAVTKAIILLRYSHII